MIVVDASLAAKWVLWEEGSERAFQFFDRFGEEIAAPDLLLSEVAAAIVFATLRTERLGREEGAAALAQWTGFWRDELIQAHRMTADLMDHAAGIALAIEHKLPECVYLALAIELQSDLVTCDARFAAKARPHFPGVRLLEELDLA